MKKICIGCNETFEAYHPEKQKYCSILCGQKHKRELARGKPARHKRTIKLDLKPCEQCGKEFKPRDETTKYCSTNCRDIARKIIKEVNIKTKECKNCGKVFEYSSENQLHCSTQCKVEYNRKNPSLAGRKGPIVKCEKCGKDFKSWRSDKLSKFCSSECSPQGRVAKKESSICQTCGVLFRRYGGGKDAKFCSRECYIKSNPKEPTLQGYILMYDNEYSDRESGQVFEHRLVMGKSLGRKLEPWETVHHINGDRSDNRIENLQLRSGKHGKGVVHCCADCGSTNIVSKELN